MTQTTADHVAEKLLAKRHTAMAAGDAPHADGIADQFVYWVRNRSEKWGAPIVDAPEESRRDDFVLQYLRQAEADHVAVILKGRGFCCEV